MGIPQEKKRVAAEFSPLSITVILLPARLEGVSGYGVKLGRLRLSKVQDTISKEQIQGTEPQDTELCVFSGSKFLS